MEAGSFRFEIGEFEFVSVSDGALNYPPESFFANVPLERVEEALRERNLPTTQVMTPYIYLPVYRFRRASRAGRRWGGRPWSTCCPDVPGPRSFYLRYRSVT